MKFAVILDNGGGELARENLELLGNADGDTIDNAIQDVLQTWMISIGDTIRIEEIES